MMRHIVLLDLPVDYDQGALAEIMDGLDALRAKLPGFVHFEHGVNKDFENMSKDCSYGFICHFADENTSHSYLADPDHQALGQRLVGLCRGGVQGIKVIDLALAA